MKIEIKCLNCSKTFRVFQYHEHVAKFCCRECKSKYGFSEETREKMSKAKIGKKPWNKGVVFKQMIGNKHAFKGNTASHWAGHKRAQKILPTLICNRCEAVSQLIIHHKNENPLDNRKANLEVLCRSCHINHHRSKLKVLT